MELIGILEINNTPNIVMLPITSRYFSIKFAEQYIYTLNYKDSFSGLKGSIKMQNRESLFK